MRTIFARLEVALHDGGDLGVADGAKHLLLGFGKARNAAR